MYNLVLVGGTGQQFGVVLGWLNQLGLITPPNKLAIVDADVNNPNFTKATEGLSFANPNFEHFHIQPYEGQGEEVNLKQELAITSQNSPLLDLLFTQDESNMNLRQGFFANPKLGSTIFTFTQKMKTTQSIDQIFGGGAQGCGPTIIVGSVAGGTGAGLMYSIAQTFHKARGTYYSESPICGFIFSKYMILPDGVQNGSVTNDNLRFNSMQGINFLWNKSNRDPNFPFDMIDLIGPGSEDNDPIQCPNVSEADVLPFTGFLLAAKMLSDTGANFFDGLRQHLTSFDSNQQHNRFNGFHIHAVRDNRNRVEGVDVIFKQSGRGVNGDDLPIYLTTTQDALREITKFDIKSALSPFSLWPLRRLPKEIVDFIAKDNQKISRRKVNDFFDRVQKISKQINENLNEGGDSFRSWLNSLDQYGYITNRKRDSQRIDPKPWQTTLTPVQAGNDQFVPLIMKDVCLGQLTGEPPHPDNPSDLRWGFPYMNGQPSKLGRQKIPTYTTGNARVFGGLGSCYPTPAGRVEGFTADLRSAILNADVHAEAYRTAEILWYGLVLGDLKLQNINLTKESNLERLLSDFEGLKTIGIITDNYGNFVGGTHPNCGLWAGVASDPVLKELEDLIHSHTKRAQARQVLQKWYHAVQPHTHFMGSQPLWFEFLTHNLTHAGAGSAIMPPIDMEDLGTHLPIELDVGQGNIPLYPFIKQTMRRQLIKHLIYSISDENNSAFDVRFDQTPMRNRLLCTFQGRSVAELNLGAPRVMLAPTEVDTAINEGMLSVTFFDHYPISVIPYERFSTPIHTEMVKMINYEWMNKYGLQIAQILNKVQFSNQHVRVPEVFWSI
jgi:hypothetical protein